jgi:hypothetical protein
VLVVDGDGDEAPLSGGSSDDAADVTAIFL